MNGVLNSVAWLILVVSFTVSALNNNTPVADLPLIEVQATAPQRDEFAILWSGDGGWVEIDHAIASGLAAAGIKTVGLNALQYFWTARTPDQCAADLERTIKHYMAAWDKKHVLLIGYSLGADALPFAVSRLDSARRQDIELLCLTGISPWAEFQFRVTDWFGGGHSKNALPVLPEIQKLTGMPMVYCYGADEKENLAGAVDTAAVTVVKLKGGHHFDNRFDLIVKAILDKISPAH